MVKERFILFYFHFFYVVEIIQETVTIIKTSVSLLVLKEKQKGKERKDILICNKKHVQWTKIYIYLYIYMYYWILLLL